MELTGELSMHFRVCGADDRTEVKHGLGRHLVDVDREDLQIFMQVSSAVRVHLMSVPDTRGNKQIVSTCMMIFFNALFFTRLAVLLFIRRLLTLCRSPPASCTSI